MKESKNQFKKNLLIVLMSLLLCMAVISLMTAFGTTSVDGTKTELKEITYNVFIDELKEGNIESVTIKGDIITAKTKEKDHITYKYIIPKFEDPNLIDRLIDGNVEFNEVADHSSTVFGYVISLLPLVFLVYFFHKMGKGNSLFGSGLSNAKQYNVQKNTGIQFSDVAGEDEAKESLAEIVDFLHNPGKYKKIGARLPKGALLVGPPGTGKTLLAKAVAGEAKVPFYSLSGSDFVEMFVGMGARRVRDLFKLANQTAPCIIFIDEIDAIGKSRDSHVSTNDEREQTLNQLLSEMDGFDPSKGIIVLGATNRPEILDPALLRPGRFDRRVVVERPDLKGREDILTVHAKNVQLDETVDLGEIALATSGVSGADLANMINESAIIAAKKNQDAISQKDLFEAVEIVLVGKEKKDRVLGPEEKRIVAYHEIGHAFVTAMQKHTEPIQKITIIPRTMGALGYVMQVPEKEKYLNSKSELEEQIVILLAGRAAEEVFFHTVTTGAANDIEKATSIARAMITQYGMSEKFGLAGFATVEDQYLGKKAMLRCGDLTAAEIDNEIVNMLKDAYKRAKDIIESHQNEIMCLAEFLIKKETITGKEFMKLLDGNKKTGI